MGFIHVIPHINSNNYHSSNGVIEMEIVGEPNKMEIINYFF